MWQVESSEIHLEPFGKVQNSKTSGTPTAPVAGTGGGGSSSPQELPVPRHVQARLSECMEDVEEKEQAAILVPPDGGPGANIDIESTVYAGKKRHGS